MAVLATIGAPVLQVAAQATAEDFPTAAVAPEDALAYIVFPLDEASAQWQLAKTLLDRAGLGAALEQAWDEALTDAAGSNLPVDAFLGGEAALVVTEAALAEAFAASEEMALGGFELEPEATPVDPVGPPAAMGGALVLEARAPDTAFAGIQAAMADDAAQGGVQVVEVDYEGVTIQYGGGAADGSYEAVAIAQVDDLILIAGSPADLEPLIDTSQGATPSLLEFDPFAAVRAELDDDYLVFGFFNGVVAGEAQADLGGFGATAGALGATNSHGGFVVRADDPGFRLETVAIAADGGTLPAAANFESELLTRAPGDALLFLSAFDLGQTGFLDAIGATLLVGLTGMMGSTATPTPDQAPEDFIAAQYEQAAALIGFNLQTDFFQQLSGEYGLWIRSGLDQSDLSALFVSGVTDPGTVVNALSQLTLLIQSAGGGTAGVTTRLVNGSQISVFDAGDPTAPAIEYGVVGDQFVFGVGPAVDDFVEGPDESLADNPQFQEVRATLPAATNGMLYLDLAQIIPWLQGLAAMSDETGEDEFGIVDASPDCMNYATQEEAQAAYDAEDEGTFDLDQDLDGEVCEDFFGAETEEDDGLAVADEAPAVEAVAGADYSAITAFALVAYEEDGMARSSAILFIDE